MKEANVTSVRTICPPNDNPPDLEKAPRSRRQRIEMLLGRYPATTEAENAEILHFLACGPHLDVGLVLGNDELKEKVGAFKRANASHFRLKPREVLLFVMVTGIVVGPLFWQYL